MRTLQKDYIALIKSFKKEDFEKDINLHIHTTFSDGKSSPEEIVKRAKELSFKYISISDHNTLNAYLKTNILDENFIIPAIEFDCWDGTVFLHLLGYGIDVNNKEIQALCAKSKKETELDIIRIFSSRHPKKCIEAIHNAGGIAVLAHPACCFVLNLSRFVKKMKNYGLDGMEVFYPYHRHRKFLKFNTVKNVERIADKYELIKTGGTDCHTNL